MRPSELTKLKERDELASGSLADIEPRAVIPSALFAMDVVAMIGASLTFVIENVKSDWADRAPSETITVKSTVLSAFKSTGASKLGAAIKFTAPVALSMDNKPSSFDPPEFTKE